ncbi:MAG: MoaD/ThiS family protein [Planctomycetaceae bacterium]|nr:MoaD/ThiS family protein [Planctomycetaceae bacterium]
MRIAVRLFARARDLAGGPVIELELPEGATVADVRTALLHARPQLQPLAASLHVAIGSDYAADDAAVPPGADVACFPPVSGG